MNTPIDTNGVTVQDANDYLLGLLRTARETTDPNLSEWDKPAVIMVGADYFPHLEMIFSELTRLYAMENRLREQRSAAGSAKTRAKIASARAAAKVRRLPDDQASPAALYQRKRRAKLKRQKKS